MLLIITNKEDVHPSPVIELFNQKQVSVFRLNTEALLTDYEFSWWCENGNTDFYIKNTQNGLSVLGSDITAIWERRPEEPKDLPITSTPEIDKHNREEALGFLRFLRFYLKDIFSIGSIANDRIAASKMLQTRIASDVGFLVPDTCFSNRKSEILNFAKKYEYIILKSIDSDNVWNERDEMEYVFYAQKVKTDLLCEMPEEAFLQTVSYVQNYVEKEYELRITVVCEQVFACKIDSQLLAEDKGKVDWRQGYNYGMKHTIYELPAEVSGKCVEFLQRMGLNFGCFDFIVTPSGGYVFLECNPNGQWLWVELETGLPISKAIAEELEKRV
ncbi:MAG: hypothetical protein LBO69_01440 [Ignavibacteria bacterium]|jgi:glutathione synthase/RimK-type ligase-like ATP-grasp enzyme|nr:hypothetical protein [Ignavibacteria bacterium]